MPGVPADTGRYHVCDYGTHAECFAGKVDLQRTTHEATATIRADEITNSDILFTSGALECSYDTLFVLLEPDELAPEFRTVPELCQTLS